MRLNINGILLLDKPVEMTSNFALQKIKRLFNAKKAGHTGSLDPIATGMLPICFGEATKFSQFLLESDKTYRVCATLGEQTTTGDIEGEIIARAPVPTLDQETIENVFSTFLGTSTQIPPMFSAIKHQGKPLYELARKGIAVERKPRAITLFSLKFESLSNNLLTFYVHCSKGTYVRTLVEDIAKALGTVAHVLTLRRLAVTPYGDAIMHSLKSLEEIREAMGDHGLSATLLPVETSVKIFPAIKLSTSATFYLKMGQAVRAPFAINDPLVRLMAEDGRFLGIGEVLEDGRVKPHRMLSQQDRAPAKAVC